MKESTRQIIEYVIFFAIIIGVALLQMPIWAFMLTWVILSIAWILFSTRARNMTEDKLKKKIIERLNYEGYECKLEEGNIVIKKRDRNIEVFLFRTTNPKIIKVVFQYASVLGNPDDIHWVGSMVLSDVANDRFRTKIRGDKGRYFCSYETAIGDAKDFINEFAIAWDCIMETIGWMSHNWDECVRRWPAERTESKEDEHTIGFKK